MQRTSRTLFRFAERCFEWAIGNPQTRFEGKFREVRLIQVTSRLGRKQVVELTRRLLELETWLETADDQNQDRRYVVTLAISPVERNDR